MTSSFRQKRVFICHFPPTQKLFPPNLTLCVTLFSTLPPRHDSLQENPCFAPESVPSVNSLVQKNANVDCCGQGQEWRMLEKKKVGCFSSLIIVQPYRRRWHQSSLTSRRAEKYASLFVLHPRVRGAKKRQFSRNSERKSQQNNSQGRKASRCFSATLNLALDIGWLWFEHNSDESDFIVRWKLI